MDRRISSRESQAQELADIQTSFKKKKRDLTEQKKRRAQLHQRVLSRENLAG